MSQATAVTVVPSLGSECQESQPRCASQESAPDPHTAAIHRRKGSFNKLNMMQGRLEIRKEMEPPI